MARPTKSERLSKVFEECLAEFHRIEAAVRPVREECIEDRVFYSRTGGQWAGNLGDQFENRPKFEINRVHLSVMRIINEYRQNRITVDFVTKDGDDDAMADVCDGLYRADETDSVASEAFDNAFEEAAGGGFGAWRLRTCYVDEDSDDDRQRIKFEPITDADSSVYFDLNSKRQDKSDAMSCYVLTGMDRAAFVAEYDMDPASWPKTLGMETGFQWCTPDAVYVAEVYRVEKKREAVHIFETLSGEQERYTDAELDEDDGELRAELQAVGTVQVDTIKAKKRRVRKYTMCGGGILEDHGYILGPNIPIIPVYGKRWFLQGVEQCQGQVRLAKDPSRLYNMVLSRLGEINAYSPLEKPIFLPEQILGHELAWANDSVNNNTYLLVNPITDAQGNPQPVGPIGYTKPPDIPASLAAMASIVSENLKEVLGNQEQAEQANPNMSGKAYELVTSRLDMQAYIYMSNMAKAMRRSGEVWLGMAREAYVEQGRKMKSLGPQGELASVELQREILGDDGSVTYENDMTAASFDVAVDVGPASASKRSAVIRNLMGVMQLIQDPAAAQVIGYTILNNTDGEGMDGLRDFARQKLLALGAAKPTEEEQEEMAAAAQAQAPDPQAQLAMSLAKEAEAKTIKAGADAQLAEANAKKASADTIRILTEIDQGERRGAIETAQAIQGLMQTPQPPSGQ